METSIVGVGVGITERFRTVVEEKSTRIENIAPRAERLDVKVTHRAYHNGHQEDSTVELTLTGKGKADITISQDASKIGDNLKTFVAAYNDLTSKLKTLAGGALKGDTALGQVTMQMDLLLRTGGGNVSTSALAAAGISQGKDGNLVIDDKKMQAAITADSSEVAKLFTNDGKGLADLMGAKATSFTDKNSVISRETTQVNRELDATNTKRAALTKALTAQATALAALYSAQSQTGTGGGMFGTGSTGSTGTLFDLLG